MERYNPFGKVEDTGDEEEEGEEVAYGTGILLEREPSCSSKQHSSGIDAMVNTREAAASSPLKSRYTTSFPDPFGDLEHEQQPSIMDTTNNRQTGAEFGSARSNSVTFSRTLEDAEAPTPVRGSTGRQASGLTTFLTRATSVTSSTVTDRMNEAVGSVRSAVDSLSNQIQQVVPGSSSGSSQTISSNQGAQQQQQQQSTASYLASKLSSASQFGSASIQSQSSNPIPVISRQRVLLILEEPDTIQWPQQFINYRKFAATSSGQQSSLTSFISSATAQITSTAATSLGLGAGGGGKGEGTDLVEQVDFREVSVLSNQASSTATVLVTGCNSRTLSNGASKGAQKIIRPEFVVVRQTGSDGQLKSLVQGLDHCMVPMLQPIEIWNLFQDRYQVFSRLLRVQKRLGKENFPLIPQIYCQTSQDLANYLQNSSAISMPCLVRTVSVAKSKIKVDSIGVLKSLATLMGTTNSMGCTLEPHLEVKCDLVVQKIGNRVKLFKRTSQSTEPGPQLGEPLTSSSTSSTTSFFTAQTDTSGTPPTSRFESGRQSLLRQSSLGGSMLSSFISTSSNQQAASKQQQQMATGPGNFEKMAEVTNRYKNWMEAVAREFDNKLEVFCLKIVITTSDREYVVGMNDCSMAFLGSSENQEEDKRNFVELIINNMNSVLPDKTNLSREPSSGMGTASIMATGSLGDTSRSQLKDERSLPVSLAPTRSTPPHTTVSHNQQLSGTQVCMTGDKKKFPSQTHINGFSEDTRRTTEVPMRTYGALSSRSQSVSMNQSDYNSDLDQASSLIHHKGSLFMDRRGSDQMATDDFGISVGRQEQQGGGSFRMGQHQRQASLGQSFLDQTSTAFSSLQKQSWSFFKRLDSRTGESSSPPSVRSEQTFGQPSNNFPLDQPENSSGSFYESSKGQTPGYKSQSIDCVTVEATSSGSGRSRPPKPPPPRSTLTMQDSYSYGGSRQYNQLTGSTPHQTRQNSRSGAELNNKKPYEPYDPELAQMLRPDHHQSSNEIVDPSQAAGESLAGIVELRGRSVEGVRRNLEAMKRADSSSTTNSETTSTEDTMNNLKKTFASIFGDKCE